MRYFCPAADIDPTVLHIARRGLRRTRLTDYLYSTESLFDKKIFDEFDKVNNSLP